MARSRSGVHRRIRDLKPIAVRSKYSSNFDGGRQTCGHTPGLGFHWRVGSHRLAARISISRNRDGTGAWAAACMPSTVTTAWCSSSGGW
jgi:hypothetical protein